MLESHCLKECICPSIGVVCDVLMSDMTGNTQFLLTTTKGGLRTSVMIGIALGAVAFLDIF